MKKILHIIISAALLFTYAPIAFANDYLYQHEIINSEEAQSDLTAPITRGEYVSLINRVFQIYASAGAEFTDIDSTYQYYYDLLAAYTHGYLKGYGDSTARPGENISLVEAAVMLDRVLELKTQPDFSPWFSVPDWGIGGLGRIIEGGYMTADTALSGEAGFLISKKTAYDAMRLVMERELNIKRIDRILSIPSFDDYEITGRLSTPLGDDPVDTLIIFVNGFGPNTYEMNREDDPYRFKFHDFYADAFTGKDVAFFSYNTRGVSVSDINPYYVIDNEEYKNYLPNVQAKDLEMLAAALRKEKRLENARVYLLGWSEGAIIAPLAVLNTDINVDGLLLAGYPNANLSGLLHWRFGGEQTMFIYSIYLDIVGAMSITREQYEAAPESAATSLPGFDDIDVNKDGILDSSDFGSFLQTFYTTLLDCVEDDDYNWIKSNFMELTPKWFTEHFALGDTEDILAQLDLPITIFHGEYDLTSPVQGVYDVQQRFSLLGKSNLTVFVFDKHSHDLNFTTWLTTGEMPEGIARLVSFV